MKNWITFVGDNLFKMDWEKYFQFNKRKYNPHQGKQEKERRVRQIKNGYLKAENGVV